MMIYTRELATMKTSSKAIEIVNVVTIPKRTTISKSVTIVTSMKKTMSHVNIKRKIESKNDIFYNSSYVIDDDWKNIKMY